MEGSLTVIAEEKESGDEVECYGPFELGARNIDWLHEMYDAAWRQLEETKDVEPKTEELSQKDACRQTVQSIIKGEGGHSDGQYTSSRPRSSLAIFCRAGSKPRSVRLQSP